VSLFLSVYIRTNLQECQGYNRQIVSDLVQGRKYQRGNQQWTIQRNRQHRTHKTKTNTNNVNKTRGLLHLVLCVTVISGMIIIKMEISTFCILWVRCCDVLYDFRIKKRCSVCLYLQLFVRGLVSYLRYLCSSSSCVSYVGGFSGLRLYLLHIYFQVTSMKGRSCFYF
jgi:hypothetical protein